MKKKYMKNTNIKIELDNLKNIQDKSEKIINEVNQILRHSNSSINKFNFDLLKLENIYNIKEIKKVCINYRLRFLDVKYFKGDIPVEAIKKIDRLKKDHSTELKGFKIMAPSKLFKLVRKDDPLLFAPLGNGYYYLVYKWGNDLKPLRKILMWPLKNIKNLFITIFILTLMLTLITPQNLFTKNPSSSTFWLLYFFNLKAVMFIFFFYAISMGKNFSKFIWNSRYDKT